MFPVLHPHTRVPSSPLLPESTPVCRVGAHADVCCTTWSFSCHDRPYPRRSALPLAGLVCDTVPGVWVHTHGSAVCKERSRRNIKQAVDAKFRFSPQLTFVVENAGSLTCPFSFLLEKQAPTCRGATARRYAPGRSSKQMWPQEERPAPARTEMRVSERTPKLPCWNPTPKGAVRRS